MFVLTPTHTLLVSVFIFLVFKLIKSRHRLPLPPGPPKLPIIGSLLHLPSEEVWETYKEWSDRYESDVIHIDAAGASMVVINSVEAATELLEKRSRIYSSRCGSYTSTPKGRPSPSTKAPSTNGLRPNGVGLELWFQAIRQRL
ncbi:hypothetical protein V5O48_008179, partial [Marasmius crinis-equi]